MKHLSDCTDPRDKGKKRKGKLKEFWRYRVGDYRIITKITDQEITILVLKVAHRKDVYEDQ
ncbi:type II toxin-antitoxin system RelE/ParE family toxin [Sulfurospirillum barnesii]|uniref:type II toxin-antitoxin system RelE family toxin n=1 Tax=Sulfurospirillum barnesii TaxID=44674 RepID=UPI0012EA2B9D